MSFTHASIVGHFDPETLFPTGPPVPVRPLDPEGVERLLATYPPGVREQVTLAEGYVYAQWAPGPHGSAVHRFAYELAKQENCIAAETPFYAILYPEEARLAQAAASERWRAAKPGSAGSN